MTLSILLFKKIPVMIIIILSIDYKFQNSLTSPAEKVNGSKILVSCRFNLFLKSKLLIFDKTLPSPIYTYISFK